jgi:hypothetical protein
MKTACFTIAMALSLCAAHAQVELVPNGDFEKTTAPWYGQKLETKEGTEKIVPAPDMLSHEAKDTLDKSAGALRVTIRKDPKHVHRSHNSGAVCKLTALIPAEKTAKVRFAAKSLTGARILSVHRLWGGGSDTVLLDEKWEKHEVTLRSQHDTDALVFSLVPESVTGIQELIDGEFLLDQVSVVVLEN